MTDALLPKVSVIIPAYNAQEYLRECLESILAQSFQNWEAIIVNDGSTDSTGKIAAEYAKKYPQIKVITTVNRGQAAARNTGLDHARGEFIFFIDSDDLIHPQCLQYFTDIARLYQQGTIVFGEFIRMQSGSPYIFTQRVHSTGNNILFTPHEGICDILYQRHIDSLVCGKLIPSKILSDIRFKKGTWYEDLEVLPRIIEKSSLLVITGFPGYYYRANGNSFMHTLTPSRLHVLDVTEEFERKYASDPLLSQAARDRRFSACCNTFALLSLGMPAVSSQEFISAATKAKNDCWDYIRRYRWKILKNNESRLKNRIGAFITLFGKRAFLLAASFIYR